jgi:hypothetical protein
MSSLELNIIDSKNIFNQKDTLFQGYDLFKNIEFVKSGLTENHTTIPLTSLERAIVHEVCKNAGLLSISIPIYGSDKKRIQIIKRNSPEEFIVTQEMVEFFSKFAQIPIACHNPKYIEYYLKELGDYYNCHLWDIFIKEVREKGLPTLKHKIGHVRTEIIKYFRENQDYINLCSQHLEPPKDITTKDNIYNATHVGKYFLSVDVKFANYTYLKSMCPSITHKWEDLVLLYVDSQFIAKSKYIREIIFGELGNRKLLTNILSLVKRVIDIIKNDPKLLNTMKKVMCSIDEVIYEVDKEFDVNAFIEIVKTIDPDETTYRIEKFKLIQLKPYSYFVKEIHTGKVQFKSIQKNFVLQCIKYYQGKQLELFDKKFMQDGFEATFDDELIFESQK